MKIDELLKLTATATLPKLGPGPRSGVSELSELDASLASIFGRAKSATASSELIRALVYLWHDYLDESHTISQGIENADGSFVHGIMHRREPDYGNARYWFHRVGEHPAFPELARRTAPLLASVPDLQKRLLDSGDWHPVAFIEACEKAARSGTHEHLLREVQAAELRWLLEYFAKPD